MANAAVPPFRRQLKLFACKAVDQEQQGLVDVRQLWWQAKYLAQTKGACHQGKQAPHIISFAAMSEVSC